MPLLSKVEINPSKGKYFHEKMEDCFLDYCRIRFPYKKFDSCLIYEIRRTFDVSRINQHRFGISLINNIYMDFINFEMNTLPCNRFDMNVR